jgi:hypothetical protein
MRNSITRYLLTNTIEDLNVEKARQEVEPFIKDPQALASWSMEFPHEAGRVFSRFDSHT